MYKYEIFPLPKQWRGLHGELDIIVFENQLIVNKTWILHVAQLLSVLHSVGESLDRNIQTDILYLDFAKALIVWITSFLLRSLNGTV